MGCSRPVRQPTNAKKTSKESDGSFGEHAGNTGHGVVEGPVGADGVLRPHSPGLRVVGRPHNAFDSSINEGPSTHWAGFERNIQGRTDEPPMSDHLRGATKGHDLGMGRWIAPAFAFIVARGEHLSRGVHHHAPYGHVIVTLRTRRLGEREGHGEMIYAENFRSLVHSTKRPGAGCPEGIAATPPAVDEVHRHRTVVQDHHGVPFCDDKGESVDLLTTIVLSWLVQSQPNPGTTSPEALEDESYRLAFAAWSTQVFFELLERLGRDFGHGLHRYSPLHPKRPRSKACRDKNTTS